MSIGCRYSCPTSIRIRSKYRSGYWVIAERWPKHLSEKRDTETVNRTIGQMNMNTLAAWHPFVAFLSVGTPLCSFSVPT